MDEWYLLIWGIENQWLSHYDWQMLKSLPSCILLVNHPRDPLLTSINSGVIHMTVVVFLLPYQLLRKFQVFCSVPLQVWGRFSPYGVLSLGLSSGRWPTDNRSVHTRHLGTWSFLCSLTHMQNCLPSFLLSSLQTLLFRPSHPIATSFPSPSFGEQKEISISGHVFVHT